MARVRNRTRNNRSGNGAENKKDKGGEKIESKDKKKLKFYTIDEAKENYSVSYEKILESLQIYIKKNLDYKDGKFADGLKQGQLPSPTEPVWEEPKTIKFEDTFDDQGIVDPKKKHDYETQQKLCFIKYEHAHQRFLDEQNEIARLKSAVHGVIMENYCTLKMATELKALKDYDTLKNDTVKLLEAIQMLMKMPSATSHCNWKLKMTGKRLFNLTQRNGESLLDYK
eukprot:scaffold8224_cov77-Cylindrotheca_fusiformis.AAC.1